MAARIRIVIADDTEIALEGMTRILTVEEDMEVVARTSTIHETLRKTIELQPDVLLLDLHWFGDEQAGIEVIKRLRQEAPHVRVVAITIYPHLIEYARGAGAAACVTKTIPRRQLVDEIRNLYAVPPALPSAESLSQESLLEELSGREREVLALIAAGKTDKEIAKTLTIAQSTAKNHVGNILNKLSVPNRAGAVALGIKLGIIGSDTH